MPDASWTSEVSRRNLAHLMTALADAAHAEAGVGVSVAALDEAIGRGRRDMRTPLNLAALEADGLVRRLEDGTWALTEAGVQRLREDEELSDR
jgi:DNA-binding transcriptional ArsR family regulator